MAIEEWDFDLVHSSIDFWVPHRMLPEAQGRFTKWKMMEATEPAKSRVEVCVDASSVDTKERQRDGHLRDRAPDFALPDQDGVSLRGLLAHYFYPKDDTPGCTPEACSFRDEHQELAKAGATIVGVSSGDEEAHRRFAGKHPLQFRPLSDRGGELRRRLGVPQTLGLIAGRVTNVIDGQGVIDDVFNSQLRTRRHVEEALRLVRSVQGRASATRKQSVDRPGDGSPS